MKISSNLVFLKENESKVEQERRANCLIFEGLFSKFHLDLFKVALLFLHRQLMELVELYFIRFSYFIMIL